MPTAAQRPSSPPTQAGMGSTWLLDSLVDGWTIGKGIAALPFDTLRANYARAVRVGLVKNSMLASRDFEQAVGAMERAALGPFARRV